MTRAEVFYAPGKLVVVGEYAVLDGAGAVVAAVDRGVSCAVSPPQVPGQVEIVTPGDDRFVRAALAGAPPARYTFADWNPAHLADGAKPGFGGSAAATVAAILAAGAPPERAFEVHHAVQGSGSGVDVFAALYGGVRHFPSGARCALPDSMQGAVWTAVWSGASAQTGPRVARYRAWAGREAFVAASRAIVAGFEADPIGAMREGYRCLQAMAADAGVDYDRPLFQALAAAAAEVGGAAKPSGAGGGDVAIALLPDIDAYARFQASLAAVGGLELPIRISAGAAPPSAGARR